MKKKILIIALSFVVLASTIAGATTAYFTDTDSKTNVFTVGKVDIALTETVADGVTTNADGAFDFGKVFPGLSYTKKPVIKVDAESETAYVGAIITLKNVDATNASANIATLLDATNYAAFLNGIATKGNVVTYTETADSVVIYVVKEAVLDKNAEVTLFDAISVDKDWLNADMAHLENLNIVIDAYAVQTAGLDNGTDRDATNALKAAFPVFEPAN